MSIVGAMTTTTARLALACLCVLACFGCRRPDRGADARVEAEIAGAWVRPARDGGGVEGFELRPGGRLEILNAPAINGVAWNVSQGELVVSTSTERVPQPNASRLRIAAHTTDTLELESPAADFFVGRYRRARAVNVAGVVTYLEPTPLPPEAQVELALVRGHGVVAHVRFAPRGPVPIPFELAYLPEEGAGKLALAASIAAGGETLFVTPAPLSVTEGEDVSALEVVVRRGSEPE